MALPRNYESLRAQIARRHTTLSNRLRRIAEFAVHNPNEMALDTVAVLAGRIGVQPSSIIRFANSFGFDGFSEMQQVFRSRLVADSGGSYRERIASIRALKGKGNGGNGGNTDAASVLAQALADDIGALEDMHADAAGRDLERAVAMLARAKAIYVIGQRRAFPVAFYLHYGLCRLDLKAFLIDSVGGTAEVQARAATRDDALIAVSFKDYAAEVVRSVHAAAERKVPLIAFTDGPFSPIAAPAAVSFELPDRPQRALRSLVAPICLAQSLVLALGHHIAGRA